MTAQVDERTRLLANNINGNVHDDESLAHTPQHEWRGWCGAVTGDSSNGCTKSQQILPARILVGIILVLLGAFVSDLFHRGLLRFQTPPSLRHDGGQARGSRSTSTYKHVQGIGFQIYTGGAPARIKAANGTIVLNPECHPSSYGQVVTDAAPELQCYLGGQDSMDDARRRVEIMKQAVMQAHETASPDQDVLKLFIAPEFFWRGATGAYIFAEEEVDDDSICGPICFILQELEAFVANKLFEDWVFLFGTIIASEQLPREDHFDYLFYNFAPVYKGYDPQRVGADGKRFLLPKRYVSSSDFLTPQRNLDLSVVEELLGQTAMTQLQKEDTTVSNPFDDERKRYDDHIWLNYKADRVLKGYAMIEYDWLMIDGLAFSMEVCFDHQMHTALNTYLGDLVTGRQRLIPSSSDQGLSYVSMPPYQAQISVVSSAGMTIVPESMALADHGVIFLQDGLSNATNRKYWSKDGCELGFQFDGGTEAVKRRTLLSPTDVSFLYDTLEAPKKSALNDWEASLRGFFSTMMYPPEIVMFAPVVIAKTL